MLGVPREEAEHSLDLDTKVRPVKQRLRRFAQDRKEAIRVEVTRLLAAGFIREVAHPDWLANPVLVISITALRTPFLYRASIRSSTRRPGAFSSLFLTVTQVTIR